MTTFWKHILPLKRDEGRIETSEIIIEENKNPLTVDESDFYYNVYASPEELVSLNERTSNLILIYKNTNDTES